MNDSKIKKASEIIFELQTKNWSITDDNNLFKQYQEDQELQDITQEMAEGLHCRLLSTSRRLYLLANSDNSVFTKTNYDIKNELRFLSSGHKDLSIAFNLQMFIIATFFMLVSDDEDESIQFYQVRDLDEKTSERLTACCQRANTEAKYDYPALKAFFDSMTGQRENGEEKRKNEVNKIDMYKKTLSFLKTYELIEFESDEHYLDSQIYPQKRLKDLLKYDLDTEAALDNYSRSHNFLGGQNETD